MRGETFVTKKLFLDYLKYFMARIAYIWVIYTLREIGGSKDFVEMQWLMLHQNFDYVIATGNNTL